MADQRYYTRADGLSRIKRIMNRFRSPYEPDDPHELSAKDLVETLERWSVHPDLKWASHLITSKLWGHGLCTQAPVGDGTKSIFTIDWQVVADAFRAAAAKTKRN